MRILLVLLAFWALPAQADENDSCRCARSKASVQRDFDRADIVFVGSVPAVQYVRGPARRTLQMTTFQVTRVFKGELVSALFVYTDLELLCSYEFEAPREYVVYAWKEHRLKNLYTTTRCVRTAPVEEAVEDFEQLPAISGKEVEG